MTLQLIFSLFFIAAASAMFLLTLWQLLTALESRKWPAAPGVVTNARIKEDRSDNGTVYWPEVWYRFTVNGEERTGNRAFYGGSTTRAFAWTLVRKYPIGTAVQVHYDPDNPKESVLEPGVQWPLVATMLVTLLFLAIGIFALRSAAGAPDS
jgi:Protein of unknown function (DUF3592)